MAQLIRYKNGVTIEVAPPADRAVPVKESAVEKIDAAFDKVLETLKPVVEPIEAFVSSFPRHLEECEVKIGVGFTAEGSLFVAKASAEANLEIKLVFRREAAAVAASK